jgi:hypothetical protein
MNGATTLLNIEVLFNNHTSAFTVADMPLH